MGEENNRPLAGVHPEEAARIRALPWSIGFATLTSAVFGAWTFFGSVFLMYLQELGLPKGQIGALLAIFPFCGLLAPVVAPALARWGAKRACLTMYGGRSVVTALLLLLPLVLAGAGRTGGIIFLAGVVLLFALFRSLAETAQLPWSQHYVPDRVRGKYGAINGVISTLASVTALGVAGYVVSRGTGLGRFLGLQAAGCAAGLIGTLMLTRVPGGGPVTTTGNSRSHRAELRDAFRDGNFRCFLYGTAGLTLGGGMLTAFLPLLLVERVGLPPGTVIWLDNAGLIGGMATVYLWGWLADRHGSRKVLLPGLVVGLAMSVLWCGLLATGRATALTVPELAVLGVLTGMASSAVGIGTGRLLLTGVIPRDRNVAYTAIYYAWCGLTGGLAPLLAGGILSGVARLFPTTVDPYAVLFWASLIPSGLGWRFFYRTRPESDTRTRDWFERLAGQAVNLALLTTWGTNVHRVLTSKLPQRQKPPA